MRTAKNKKAGGSQPVLQRFLRSIWLFPALLFIVLLLFTAFKINGSSIGVYNIYFNGERQDPDLLANKPRPIRSDEWIVNTQMTIAQSRDGFQQVNENIGDGQDMSVILDVPHKSWSAVFSPQNWAFFVLPFDHAFAFKWWLLAYLLLVSCYFFILALLPKRKWLAIILPFVLLFAAFVQWWYQYSTLSSLYYPLFIATIVIMIVRQRRLRLAGLWGMLLAYLLVCFALVLYPPFQIPCALVAAAFCIGYLLESRTRHSDKYLLQRAGIMAAAVLVAGAVVGAFLLTRADVVHTVANTAYPGKRVIVSGGQPVSHTFSGHLGAQLQLPDKAGGYRLDGGADVTNQSEASNFILVLPFLLLPALYLLYRGWRRKQATDWLLALTSGLFLLLAAWMFVPGIDLLGKLLLLDKVPHIRLLIGLGLLSFIHLVLVIRHLQERTDKPAAWRWVIPYILLVFAAQIGLGWLAQARSFDFITMKEIVLLGLAVPLTVLFVLRKWFVAAALVLAGFSIHSSALTHPLYRGTSIVQDSTLSRAIRDAADEGGKWAIEPTYLENFAIINGADSLSGVYTYPQLELWEDLEPGDQEKLYNRYAHMTFNFDRDAGRAQPDRMELPGPDHVSVDFEPCSSFLEQEGVRFLLTEVPLANEPCLELVSRTKYPEHTYYIYRKQ